MLHEFGHVNGLYIGFYSSINNNYNKSVAKALDEVYAHRFANKHGVMTLNINLF